MEVSRDQIIGRLDNLEATHKALHDEIAATRRKLHEYDASKALWRVGDVVRYSAAAIYRADRGKAFVIDRLTFRRDTGEIDNIWGVPLKKDGTRSRHKARWLFARDHLELVR